MRIDMGDASTIDEAIGWFVDADDGGVQPRTRADVAGAEERVAVVVRGPTAIP